MATELYDVGFVVVGCALLGVAILPRFVSDEPVSMPLFFVGFGILVFGAPLGLPAPDPLERGHLTERLAEFVVIVALMGVGFVLGWLLARGSSRWSTARPRSRGLRLHRGVRRRPAAPPLRAHTHEYNESLHEVSEMTEQAAMGFVMVLFGGAIAGGLLAPLTTEALLAAVSIVFVVRPLAGIVGLLGVDRDWSERGVIAFYGIRGVGSFYYLSHGLNEAAFTDADLLWAVVGAVVLVSIVVHGITAAPAVKRFAPG